MFKSFRTERFGQIYDVVLAAHEERARKQGDRGHGWDHVLLVCGFCIRLSDEEKTAELAWLAGLVHNNDHFFGKGETGLVHELTRGQLDLLPPDIPAIQRHSILDAAIRHQAPKAGTDTIVKIILQDADKLASLEPNLILIRAGQFYSQIPAVEIPFLERPNPRGTFHSPSSVLEDLRYCLEWRDHPQFGLRLQLAKEIAAPWFEEMEAQLQNIRRPFLQAGLWPPLEDA